MSKPGPGAAEYERALRLKFDPTAGAMPEHIRAAIHAGHIGQVTIFCDNCGTEDTADYTGATREARFAAARQHLAWVKGWKIAFTGDFCPACAGNSGGVL